MAKRVRRFSIIETNSMKTHQLGVDKTASIWNFPDTDRKS